MFEKLLAMYEKYQLISQQLSLPEVLADHEKYMILMKEYQI